MITIAHDLRYALRMLARSPRCAAIAIFTLAVDIRANTAIFSVADALLLRPPAYERPDRLVLARPYYWFYS